ncbi:MAG: YybS family protein [Selenomonadales bacterium]|nr:YybS family protein [Selenomonadales bacterium]
MAIIARFGDIAGRRSDVMQGVKARGVVEGGLLAASLATIALLSMYIPYVNLLWPLPIALVSARHGVRYGVMTAVAGALVVGLLVHMMTGLFLFLSGGLVGVALGECLRRGVSAGRTLSVSTFFALASNVLTIVLAMAVMQVDLAELNQQMQDGIMQGIDMIVAMTDDEASRAQMVVLGESLMQLYKMMLPSVLLICSLITAVVNFVLARVVLARLGMETVSFGPFEMWRFPSWVLYLFVLSLVGLYWGDKWADEMLITVSWNVQLTMSFVLFVQGAALLRYIANRNVFVKKIWWLLIVIALFSQFFTTMMVVFGGIDMLINYRNFLGKQV